MFRLTHTLTIITILLFTPLFAHAGVTLSKPPVQNNIGLVGHWTFDGNDTIWTSATEATTLDKSGNGNTGTLTSMAQATAPAIGKIGQGARFDGVDDTVTVVHNAALNPISAITVAFWIKVTNAPAGNSGSLIEKGGITAWRIRCANTTPCTPQIVHSSALGASGSALTLNTWTHVVAVADGAGSRIYTNAVSGSAHGTAYSGAQSTDSLIINIAAIHPTGMIIDDVRVYSRALSASEISALYNAGQAKVQAVKSNDVTDGLVGHWTFDGADGGGRDQSGNGNHGALSGTSTSTASVIGKVGQAFEFDGVDDYVNVPDSNAFDSLEGVSGVTVAFWVKNNNQVGYFVSRSDGTLGRAFAIKGDSFFTLRPEWRYGGSGSAGTNLDHACNTSTCPIPIGQWTHVVAIYNDPTSYIYINGALKSTQNGTGGVTNTGISSPINIGASNNPSVFANATLDDLRIYNRALSADEIKRIYNSTAGDKVNKTPTKSLSDGLVGHWTFDGQDTNWTANTVADKSGNGNTGTLTSMAQATAPTIGKIGQGLKFDGVDDRVLISTVPTITQPYTVTAWFNFSILGTNKHIITFGSGNPTPTIFITDNNIFEIDAFSAGTFRTFCNKTFTSADLNKWHHLTIIINSTTDASQWKCYLNNSDIGVTDSNSTGTYSNPPSTNWTIGNYPGLSSRFFNGLLDDVRIYSRALSASEIKQLYNMGK